MSNSLLSRTIKSNFQGVYLKETKKGRAFIARYTLNKKTTTQIIGYEKDGMTEYEAYKARLNMIASQQLMNAVENLDTKKFYIDILFDNFIKEYSPQLSKNTQENYRSIYNQYIVKDFKDKDIRNISQNQLQNYINQLLTYRRPATVDKVKSALNKFYLHLQNNGIYKYNPAANLVMPKYDNKKYFSMTKKDIQKVIDYIADIDSQLYRTLYTILLHGRRINEVLTLQWSNVDFTSKIYYLDYDKTKTRKNQYYYLEEYQVEELLKLRSLYPTSKYVFENPKTKKPITYTSFFRVHKKLRKDLNLPDFVIHNIRHMVAFLLVNNGYSLEITAKVLGHQNIQSTQRYATLEINKAKEAYKKTFAKLGK